MAGATSLHLTQQRAGLLEQREATREPRWVKALILTVALGFFAVFLVLPLLVVFVNLHSARGLMAHRLLSVSNETVSLRVNFIAAPPQHQRHNGW